MNWKSRSVLVTGAGGFISSHLAEALVRAGAQTRAMVHYNGAGRRGRLEESEAREEMEFVVGDVTTPSVIVLDSIQSDFHLENQP